MNRLVILAAMFAAASALADENEGRANRAHLDGLHEVPSVVTVGTGDFAATVAADGMSIAYQLNYSGLQGTVRQAHIHVAQPSVSGAIVLWLCGSTQNPGPAGTQSCPQTGMVSGTLTNADVQASTTQQVATLANVIDALRSGDAYVNVHTDLSPAGEIRGQIGGGHSAGHQDGD
jgi:hypothetical protein